ncbi:hypothetical protein BSKO_07382 [Bryopsis sp. KO-2023]|nr:hypothetical protein BSKO_07382 [Bryopsis sp. KO-2023]
MFGGARRISFASTEDLCYPHEDQRLPASARVALERAHLLLANQRGSGCSNRSNCRMRSSSRRGSGRNQTFDGERSDMGRYHRSSSQQLEQAMSRLELARAYGMRASERNRKKQGTRSKSTSQQQQQHQQKNLRRSLSAGGALYTESIPENIACHRDAGYMSKRRAAAYLDGDDHEVRLHDWVRCSSMYRSDVSRDSQGSPVSGQDPVNPLFMSSTCISEAISGVADRVDRGVQTSVEIGGAFSKSECLKVEKQVQTEAPWRSVGTGQEGGDSAIVSQPLGGGDVAREAQQLYSGQSLRKGEDEPAADNPEEAEMQRRVEELRKSVAAMRSEARMLELQTEERVLLKEMSALGGYLRNARSLLASLDKITPLDGDNDTKANHIENAENRSVEKFEAQEPEVQSSGEADSDNELVADEQQSQPREMLVETERSVQEGGVVVEGRREEPANRDEMPRNQQRDRDALHSEEADSLEKGMNAGAVDLDTPRGRQGGGAQGGGNHSHEVSRGTSSTQDQDAGEEGGWGMDTTEMSHDDVCAGSPVNTAALELSDSEKEGEGAVMISGAGYVQPAPIGEESNDMDMDMDEEEEEEDMVHSFREFDLSAFNGGPRAGGGDESREVIEEDGSNVEDVIPSSSFTAAHSNNGMVINRRADAPAAGSEVVLPSQGNERQMSWMHAEDEFDDDDGELSLEERSMQMMMRMHDDQVKECGDYMSDYMAARIQRDGASLSMIMSDEVAEEDNETSNPRDADYEQDDQQVLMELESILQEEAVQATGNVAEGEEFESAKLDMSPRTWRLDFDIHEVEDCPTADTNINNSSSSNNNNHIITNENNINSSNGNNNNNMDAESEELLAAQESNRESVSSRELSTRTDSDYIEEFVEEVMRTFQSNTPDFSSAFTAPVPWKVFVDIQLARKSNKDQSIFDRCIFEALNEAVADTYRTCNRVLSINRSDDEEEGRYIALPPDEEWIYDVKNKVLKAVNHRSLHSDAIGAILSQDVFYLHNSVMDLHDELGEVQKEQLYT